MAELHSIVCVYVYKYTTFSVSVYKSVLSLFACNMQVEEIENMAIHYPCIFDPGHLSIHLHPRVTECFRAIAGQGMHSWPSVGNGLENV